LSKRVSSLTCSSLRSKNHSMESPKPRRGARLAQDDMTRKRTRGALPIGHRGPVGSKLLLEGAQLTEGQQEPYRRGGFARALRRFSFEPTHGINTVVEEVCRARIVD
jgi:hypothetical protein